MAQKVTGIIKLQILGGKNIETTTCTAEIPVWERLCLTIEEAAAYSLIGENRLRTIIQNNQHADFILQIGNRTRIKRKEFEAYVSGLVSV